MIVKNPEPLIFQWDPGFLFASWPTFDPLFSVLIIFITERPALYYYVCKTSQQYMELLGQKWVR